MKKVNKGQGRNFRQEALSTARGTEPVRSLSHSEVLEIGRNIVQRAEPAIQKIRLEQRLALGAGGRRSLRIRHQTET